MNIEVGERGGPAYVALEEIPAGGVAKTVEIVPGELMADLGADGRLLGVEVLDPALVARVPEVMKRYGASADAIARVSDLAPALARAMTPPKARAPRRARKTAGRPARSARRTRTAPGAKRRRKARANRSR